MNPKDSYLATGFRSVDKNSDIGKLAACLQFMEALPSFVAYKSRSIEMMRLKPSHIAVDIGCGLGFDVHKLAARVLPGGKAIGVDNSDLFLEAARKAFAGEDGVEFINCDIHKLTFESNSIDAIRVDRTLQHVENPQKVISEMARVLRPGGWLVCAEPDWYTFVIDSDNINITEKVTKKWRNSFRNPNIGRQLLRRIRNEGLQNTWAEGFILLANGLEAVNIVYDIYKTVQIMESENVAEAKQFSNWLSELTEADKTTAITASVTLFLAGGLKI